MNKKILRLKIKNLILDRRSILCQAEREIKEAEKWSCNWTELDGKISLEIEKLIKEYEVKNELQN
jgi:hypothetical protein